MYGINDLLIMYMIVLVTTLVELIRCRKQMLTLFTFTFAERRIHCNIAFVSRNVKYCPEKLRRLSYISLIRSNLNIPARSGTLTYARTYTILKWSSVGLHDLLNGTIVMKVV